MDKGKLEIINVKEENAEKVHESVQTNCSGSIKPYFFKESYINESNAFTKYYEAIKKNGYISNILDDVDNMGDYCELFSGVSREFQKEQLNSFFEPIPINERNETILYASNLINILDSPNKGRLAVATKDIPKDKVLINEYPTVLQVTPLCECVGDNESSLYRCHNCGMTVRLFYTCDGCNVCIFCSRSCLNEAYKNYHRFECYGLQRHFWSMEDTDYSYLSMRMMIYGASKQFETDPKRMEYGNFENNYPFIYKLETNFDKMSMVMVNKILYSSVKNLVYLIRKTNFFNQFKNKNCRLEDLYLYVGGLMVKHYCQAQTNNVLIKYPNLTVGLNVTSGTGKAICPMIAMLNHACSPNAAIIICSNYVIVKSLRPIRRAEEITVCYSEVDALMTVEERQIVVQEFFYFTCKCTFCEFERSMNAAPYKCLLCFMGNAKEIDTKNGQRKARCENCYKLFPMDFIIENLKIATVCRNVYNVTYALEHITRIAECYAKIFHNNSLHLLDVYRLLYDKHVLWGEKPLEILKYGLLVFNIVEHCITRLYKPLLISKVKFLGYVVQMQKFSEIETVTAEEFETIKIFVCETDKVKNDLEFYLYPDRVREVYKDIQFKAHSLYQTVSASINRDIIQKETK